MNFDIFFSICQTEVDGYMPSERVMWENFFSQVRLADELGFGCAWVAETHLSCQVQKRNPGAVIPNFKGEIGLNTDILQLAHQVFARTRRIHIGSAIRNILCNGGPIAHAEAVRTFLSLHGLGAGESRLLELGFAAGRFPFSNAPYGVRPRTKTEAAAWPVLKGLVFREATEIFLRLLKGEVLASQDLAPRALERGQFRSEADWQKVAAIWVSEQGGRAPDAARLERIPVEPFWSFDPLGVIPSETPLEHLRLTIGTHDGDTQVFANRFMPTGVFQLSITPEKVIEQTHERMQNHFHPDGGPWRRSLMPRTALVFIDDTPGLSDEARTQAARARARQALAVYWSAMEGTLDQAKVDAAVDNALAGSPADLRAQLKERYHPDDRLMLWFDFHNHDNADVCRSMRAFMETVAPHV